jgi:phage/plasmid primase-like uncharacterized protein
MTELRIVPRWTTYLPHILLIALLWMTAMTMDYHDEVAQAEEQAQQMSRQMAECLSGTWRGITPSGEQIGCLPAETFKPEERSRS